MSKQRISVYARAGFTLVEIMISVAIFSLAIMITFQMMATGIDVHAASMTTSDIETQAQRALDRIVEEVQVADLSRISAPPPDETGNPWLGYRRYEGYDVNGVIQWSCDDPHWINMSFGLWDVSGEWRGDGVDNNGNGLFDESMLKRTEWDNMMVMPVEEQTLTRWVKGYDYKTEQSVEGLTFNLDGDRLIIRLELQKLDAKGNIVESAVETSIRIRNKSG